MVDHLNRRFLSALFLSVLASAAIAGGSLRIASFNLEWLTATAHENRMAPWPDEAALQTHRRTLAHILAHDVHADIVCVLESTSRAALEKLNAEPELRVLRYRVYHVESEDRATGQDVAFLSRIPLDRVNGKEIHDFRNASRSGAHDPLTKRAVIFVTWGKTRIAFLGMHLLAHPDDAKRNRKRTAQAAKAAKIIREEIVARDYQPVVLGDFNDFDSDLETPGPVSKDKVLHILKNFDRKHPGDELFNAAERIQPASERYSCYWDLNKNGKWDDREPLSLIDHILLGEPLRSHVQQVNISHVPKDGSVSDHWPVIVDLKL